MMKVGGAPYNVTIVTVEAGYLNIEDRSDLLFNVDLVSTWLPTLLHAFPARLKISDPLIDDTA